MVLLERTGRSAQVLLRRSPDSPAMLADCPFSIKEPTSTEEVDTAGNANVVEVRSFELHISSQKHAASWLSYSANNI